MGFADEVRRKIQSVKNQETSTWNTMQSHHEDYLKALRLSPDDLETLERAKGRVSLYPDIAETGSKGFLQLTVDEEEFSLAVKHVCGSPYGGQWETIVLAICMSDPSLNESVGFGTTLITVVPEEWHKKILTKLTEGDKDGGSDGPPSWLPDFLKGRW